MYIGANLFCKEIAVFFAYLCLPTVAFRLAYLTSRFCTDFIAPSEHGNLLRTLLNLMVMQIWLEHHDFIFFRPTNFYKFMLVWLVIFGIFIET